MTDDLRARCPDVTYLLSAYVIGAGSLSDEVGQFAAAEGTQRAGRALGELERLLEPTAVPDEQLDAFVLAHSTRYHGSGRATLTLVAAELATAVASPAPREALPVPPPGATPTTTAPSAPPADVHERLAAWLGEAGMIPPDDYTGWSIADAGADRWVLSPPGYAGVIFAVTPDVIRAIRPAVESVPDALRELGIH